MDRSRAEETIQVSELATPVTGRSVGVNQANLASWPCYIKADRDGEGFPLSVAENIAIDLEIVIKI